MKSFEARTAPLPLARNGNDEPVRPCPTIYNKASTEMAMKLFGIGACRKAEDISTHILCETKRDKEPTGMEANGGRWSTIAFPDESTVLGGANPHLGGAPLSRLPPWGARPAPRSQSPGLLGLGPPIAIGITRKFNRNKSRIYRAHGRQAEHGSAYLKREVVLNPQIFGCDRVYNVVQ